MSVAGVFECLKLIWLVHRQNSCDCCCHSAGAHAFATDAFGAYVCMLDFRVRHAAHLRQVVWIVLRSTARVRRSVVSFDSIDK